MKRKNIFVAIALIAVFALMLTACGSKEPAEPNAGETVSSSDVLGPVLGLASWEMSSSTWSSPNGATVQISAVPTSHTEGQSAVFCVRLEGADVENIPCEWDGKAYTAAAELNAADGYCYYVIMTGADGEQLEVAVNTPNAPIDETLINMETALNSYCHLLVESSETNGSKLTITGGSVQIQPPQITNNGEAITCTEAVLVLSFDGEEAARKELTLLEAGASGAYDLSIADISFDIPAMEDDQQLSLRLDVTLSNGQTLTDSNGTWSYIDGGLISAVG